MVRGEPEQLARQCSLIVVNSINLPSKVQMTARHWEVLLT